MKSRLPFAAFAAVLAPFAVACGGTDDVAPGEAEQEKTSPAAAETGDVKLGAAAAAGAIDGTTLDTSSVPTTDTSTGLPAPAKEIAVPYRGVNLSGAEFGTALPGKEGVDYTFPTNAEVDYYLSKGMNTFRVAFLWERLQPTKYGALAPAYLAKLESLTSYATGKGATVILEPHNFARYYGTPVGTSAVPNAVFADFWKKVAERQKTNARVVFNLVNEPNDIGSEQWVSAANAAIKAIRETGSTNVIHAPGNAWTGAHSWHSTWYGTPNAVAMLGIEDPANATIFEVHQYLDTTSGGKVDQCVSRTIGSERMKGFIDWLRQHGKKGFVGELAGGDNPTCNAAVTDMLEAIHGASDVLVGWAWWGGGPWWGDYMFSLEPKSLAGALAGDTTLDAPQMKLLSPFLAR